ncbi:MAG: hypothetical protein J2P21_24250 [Chloracidobacterium sp.]|nr:hypothetical protein [Chloracidobacterium sp.]
MIARTNPTTPVISLIAYEAARRRNAEIEPGSRLTTYAHLASIVARTGRQLKFDPKTGTNLGDAEANR